MENEKKPREELSIMECIVVLENMKGRTKQYETMFPFYSKEYIDHLAGLDKMVIDKVISILRNQESTSVNFLSSIAQKQKMVNKEEENDQ